MATGPESRLRVLWVTNYAAPYRVPVWQEIGRRVRLCVGLLERDSRIGVAGHERGVDWRSRSAVGVRTLQLRAASVARWRNYTYTLPPSVTGRVMGADVVVLGNWEAPAFWQLMISARLLKRRVVLFSESTAASRRHARGVVAAARRRFFQAADAVVVPGLAAKEAVLGLGVDPSRVWMGFNAVDVSAFGSIQHRGFDRDSHAYLFVGQLIARKRPVELVQAFRRAAGPSDRLTMVGSGVLRGKVLAAAADDPRVQVLDYEPNSALPDIFGRHDTLVLPSHEEVWGLVVNEALAAGLHVVVAERCGVMPSVQHMRGVYTVRDDLADLEAVLKRSREEWSGPVASPEILRNTPERFAGVFLAAITGPQPE